MAWAKHVRHLMAKSSRRKWSSRRLLDGHATLTEWSMDTERPRSLPFRPLANHNSIVSTCHLQDTGLHLGSIPPLYNEGATSQFFQPFSPATTLGQTKQLMACKLKQRRLVCLCVCVCVLENVGHAPSIFQGLISVLMSWFLDTARRHGCHPCGLISAVCQSTMCTNLYIGHS